MTEPAPPDRVAVFGSAHPSVFGKPRRRPDALTGYGARSIGRPPQG